MYTLKVDSPETALAAINLLKFLSLAPALEGADMRFMSDRCRYIYLDENMVYTGYNEGDVGDDYYSEDVLVDLCKLPPKTYRVFVDGKVWEVSEEVYQQIIGSERV